MHPEPVIPSTSAARLSVDPRRLSWIRRLAVDYTQEFTRLAPFFAGDPASAEAWRRVVAERYERPRPSSSVAEIVRRQQQRRGAPDAACLAAERLADPRAVAIVTGQQAGLFGGPIYTLLKAITALTLSARVTHDHGVPVVPVFWIDAEDHDWDEISTCGLLTGDLDYRTVGVAPPREAGHVPVAALRFDTSIVQALEENFSAILAPTEFTADLLKQLATVYCPNAGVSEAFARWLESLLGPHGLVVFDSSDPGAKELARDVFERELAAPGRTAELTRGAGERLEALGYHAQVTPTPDSVALFHLNGVNGARESIRHHDGAFTIGTTTRGGDELLREATASPERFSPNVLLRPVVQDSLFSTVCYVAGPNELAYLAQLKDIYAHFNVPMPLIYQRASATIVDAAATRFLSRYDVPFETLQPRDEAALNRLLESQLPPAVDRALNAAGDAVRDRMHDVIAAVPSIDPTLEGAARSTLGRMEHDLGALQNKVIQASKRRHDVLKRQFSRTRAQAFPNGQPQERAISFVYLLNQYGPGVIERLLEELPLDTSQHWIVTV